MTASRRHVLTRLAPAAAAGGIAAIPLLASSPAALAATGGTITLVSPFRLTDSRINEPGKYDSTARDGLADPALAGHQGAVLNVTVTETEGFGFFRIGNAFVEPPPTSNINWSADGQTLANLALVELDALGGFVVQGGGNGRAHLIIDVIGFIG